jgi:hypothetical protein
VFGPAGHDGTEKGQQQQAGVLIEEQLTIAGLVAGGGVALEAFEQRPDKSEVLQAVEVLVTNVNAAWLRYGGSPPSGS